jgi:hypothetical protein
MIGQTFKCNESKSEFRVKQENKIIEEFLDIEYSNGDNAIIPFDKIKQYLKNGTIQIVT